MGSTDIGRRDALHGVEQRLSKADKWWLVSVLVGLTFVAIISAAMVIVPLVWVILEGTAAGWIALAVWYVVLGIGLLAGLVAEDV